jgi:hypothetical protein
MPAIMSCPTLNRYSKRRRCLARLADDRPRRSDRQKYALASGASVAARSKWLRPGRRDVEITWTCIEWPDGEPSRAAWRCPRCAGLVPEKAKFAMVTAREWRATRPEIKGHGGFRCSALISLLANASWGRLAEEFLAARNDPAALMTFVNTVLGEVWADPANGTASCGAPGGREPHPQRAQSACHRQVCKHPRVPTAPFTFCQERQRRGHLAARPLRCLRLPRAEEGI